MLKGSKRVGVTLLSLGLLAPSLIGAAEPVTDRVASSNVQVVAGTPRTMPALAPSMVIAIDPDTGERRTPTVGEVADLSVAARYGEKRLDGADLHQFTTEGGGIGLLLDGRYAISETITLNADGSRSGHHQMGTIHSIDALVKAAMAAHDAVATKEESSETEETP